ncbi:MAG TPA: PadR family transcriptional regulator, partial [Thermomicrobiaceae bacterium]|nr:PadR family transcriptional regulator [Thermomicrobiaceae bacterium]
MARGKLSNPLAVAVLACLDEKPMHPYEMATTLRARNKHESIKLNYGSLYTVVDRLSRQGLIVPQETQREGRRPERTVYAITEAGRIALEEWLSETLSLPVKEYTQFEAALSLLPVLPPEEVGDLLEQRRLRLEFEVQSLRYTQELVVKEHIPRLFSIETEYWLTLREAELAWVTELAKEISRGSFDGI